MPWIVYLVPFAYALALGSLAFGLDRDNGRQPRAFPVRPDPAREKAP